MKSAQDLCGQIAPFTARVSGFDSAAGYEVARLIHEARIHGGAAPVGRKVGFTNRDLWSEYGAHEPSWAYVYDTTVVRLSGPRAVCRLERFTEPRIEPEIVLHFRSAPAASDDPAAGPRDNPLPHGYFDPADEDAIADALDRLPGAPPGRERKRNFRWEITAQKAFDTLAGAMNPVPKALAD